MVEVTFQDGSKVTYDPKDDEVAHATIAFLKTQGANFDNTLIEFA